MEKSDLGQIIDNPASITSGQLEALRRERDEHPFCAPLQVLSLMADKMGGTPLWESQSLPRVALYMMDAGHLYSLLESTAKQASSTQKPPEEVRRCFWKLFSKNR